MSAFKFIGYYDRLSGQVYAKKDKLDKNSIYSVYYAKDRYDYLFLDKDRMRIPNENEKKIIEIYVMQNDIRFKENMTKVGIAVASLSLLAFLKWVTAIGDLSAVIPEKKDVPKVVESMSHRLILTDGDVKNKFIDMLNDAEVNVLDSDYRILYYLYYVTYLEKSDGDDFLNHLINKETANDYISYKDLWEFCFDGKFNYEKILATPEEDANKVTYENMDIFLELNMLMTEEVREGNLDINVYEDYIGIFGSSLKKRDKDLYRVWAYQVNHASMIGKPINLKLITYIKSLELEY